MKELLRQLKQLGQFQRTWTIFGVKQSFAKFLPRLLEKKLAKWDVLLKKQTEWKWTEYRPEVFGQTKKIDNRITLFTGFPHRQRSSGEKRP